MLQRFVRVPEEPLRECRSDVEKGIAILSKGFTWHKEALKQLRDKAVHKETTGGQIVNIVAILKLYHQHLPGT